MAEENKEVMKSEEQVEVSDRGLFDFMGKKKDGEEALATGVQNVHIDDEPEKTEEKEEDLLHKLHRSHSSSSSSSDEEEEGPDGEKKKKKKGLRGKIKEKLHGGDHDATVTEQDVLLSPAPPAAVTEQDVLLPVSPAPPASVTQQDVLLSPAPPQEDTSVVVEKVEAEEKKGFLDKIKEKLPGHGHKKEAGEESTEPAKESAAAAPQPHEGGETAEKKGFLGKIMEKLPGYHKEEIDKNTPPAGH